MIVVFSVTSRSITLDNLSTGESVDHRWFNMSPVCASILSSGFLKIATWAGLFLLQISALCFLSMSFLLPRCHYWNIPMLWSEDVSLGDKPPIASMAIISKLHVMTNQSICSYDHWCESMLRYCRPYLSNHIHPAVLRFILSRAKRCRLIFSWNILCLLCVKSDNEIPL